VYYYNYDSPKSPMSTDKGTVHTISKAGDIDIDPVTVNIANSLLFRPPET